MCDQMISEDAEVTETMDSVCENQLPSKESDQNVGFCNLPNQIQRIIERRGLEFNLMVVGESGLGKSTLINSLFFTDIYSDEYPGPSKREVAKTVKVERTKVHLKEKNANLFLTIIDTPGFGCAVNNSNCWQNIIDYIEQQHEDYLNAERSIKRSFSRDNRVHCCLYFIRPSGHSLREIDVEFMLNLHNKVNIIPVIAKADSLTLEECQQFKKNVMNEIQEHKIKIYEFPDSQMYEESKQMKCRVPFAVIGSNFVTEINGKRRRIRRYRWGDVETENMDYSDLLPLRTMLLKYHSFDLIDTTNKIHYENYRHRILSEEL